MKRLTKLEIQRALLAGEKVSWTNSVGKAETLELGRASQRCLFAYLLGSEEREPKGLPDAFVAGLDKAFDGEDDPADQPAGSGTAVMGAGPWRLQRLETEGFGGLNTCGGAPFILELDGDSLLLQGPNGSGKSSLVGAIQWAITGDRRRDHSNARPEAPADVFDDNNKSIGAWPPVACYPDDPAGLRVKPYVRVTLTFVDEVGKTAVIERELKAGAIRENHDPAFQLPGIFIETGLLMPSRMPQIRFEKGQTPLTSAVQTLTGLDDLIDVGALVEGLCHKARVYLSSQVKEMAPHKAVFDAAMADVGRALQNTDETVPAYKPKDTHNNQGPMAEFGKRLKTRATDLTKVIEGDLTAGLDLTNAKVQMDVAGAISGAREDLADGLQALPVWRELVQIAAAVTPDIATGLEAAAEAARASLETALELDSKAALDSRLRLKALGAQWHEAHRHGAVDGCPLCDKPLDDPALAGEIEALRKSGETATRQLADNLNAIRAGLEAALPQTMVRKLSDVGALVPRQRLIDDIRVRFVTRERYSQTLASFTKLVSESLADAPEVDLPGTTPGSSSGHPTAADAVRSRIAALEASGRDRRLVPRACRCLARLVDGGRRRASRGRHDRRRCRA